MISSQIDRYPFQCRACQRAGELRLLWTSAGEVRTEWPGVIRRRVNLRQPRDSTAQCEACGSRDITIRPALTV